MVDKCSAIGNERALTDNKGLMILHLFTNEPAYGTWHALGKIDGT